MDSLLRGAPKLVNGYKGEALVKGAANFINGFLLRGAPKFVNGYMGEALVKDVANFINGFFVKRGS